MHERQPSSLDYSKISLEKAILIEQQDNSRAEGSEGSDQGMSD